MPSYTQYMRQMAVMDKDDGIELIDKINDIKQVLELRKK